MEDDRIEESEPVEVGAFSMPALASLARGALQAESIPCYLENEHMVRLRGLVGMRLMVPPEYAERAREVLDALPGQSSVPSEPWDGNIAHRFVEANGIRMHCAEAGVGPLVLLCHGFPESWYSWRHQLPALAEQGYHVVAPDLRGYGQTDRPQALEAYDIFQLVGDLVGLVNALDEAPAVIVGHDWGAWIAPYAAVLRPDLFRAVGLLSVPFVPRRRVSQSQWEQEKFPGKVFYQAVLRSPMAEQVLSANPRAVLQTTFWGLSGDASPQERWQPIQEPAAAGAMPPQRTDLPPWLTQEDLDYFAGEFQRSGFTGGLNYYRNMDRNWALTPFLDGAKLLQRTLFIGGERDPVLDFLGRAYEALESNVPNLWKKERIQGAGHWIQQERPDEVNELLAAFLREVEAGERAAAGS